MADSDFLELFRVCLGHPSGHAQLLGESIESDDAVRRRRSFDDSDGLNMKLWLASHDGLQRKIGNENRRKRHE
jgi:hypothetical protein